MGRSDVGITGGASGANAQVSISANARALVFSECQFNSSALPALVVPNGAQSQDVIVTCCRFVGTGANDGIQLRHQGGLSWNITNNLFQSLRIGVSVLVAEGAVLLECSENEFLTCASGIVIDQGPGPSVLSGNTFRDITNWCIRIHNVWSHEHMNPGPIIQANYALANCVHGIGIELAGGSYDRTIITHNNFLS